MRWCHCAPPHRPRSRRLDAGVVLKIPERRASAAALRLVGGRAERIERLRGSTRTALGPPGSRSRLPVPAWVRTSFPAVDMRQPERATGTVPVRHIAIALQCGLLLAQVPMQRRPEARLNFCTLRLAASHLQRAPGKRALASRSLSSVGGCCLGEDLEEPGAPGGSESAPRGAPHRLRVSPGGRRSSRPYSVRRPCRRGAGP